MILDELSEASDLDKVVWLQNGLIAEATGGSFAGGDAAYTQLRVTLLSNSSTRDSLPEFIRRCRDLSQFWQFIKYEYGHYAERRKYIWDSFQELLDTLERGDQQPAIGPIGDVLISFNADTVHAVWKKALDRRVSDPEGAITAARTLLECVCKHMLDDAAVAYADDIDLPKLWRTVAEQLNLAPHQHDEKVFKEILGSCQSIVNSLGSIRNRIGDAHGAGKRKVKPKPRHAELAVNLAGSMAAFLVSTWTDRSL